MSASEQVVTGDFRPRRRGPLDGDTILLVEDEVLIALDLQYSFESFGARVVTAHDLPEALSLYGGLGPRGITGAFLDVQLQTAEVYPLAERLQADGVPIVFHSGHACPSEIGARFPRAPLLSKPASEDLIVTTLRAALRNVRKIC